MGDSAPDAPDYVGQAEAQSEADLAMLQQQTYANRPTRTTPWGQESWTASPGVDAVSGEAVTNWEQMQTLNPELQRALSSQLGLQSGRSEIASGMLGRVGQEFGDQMDWDQFGGMQGLQFDPTQMRGRAENAMYDSMASRLDPQYEQAGAKLEVKLRNQGLVPGDQAYDAAMGNFDRAKTDAYQQASRAAIGEGRAESGQLYGQQTTSADYANKLRQQEITEEMTKRGFSLNEINALITGQQVNNPQFQSFNSAGKAEGPQYLDAAQMGYNAEMDAFSADQAMKQSMMQGAGQAAGMMAMCDRRLKDLITRIGTFRGYPLYAFRYLWGEYGIGVMADEVNPEAVDVDKDGLIWVNYRKVA